jgi:lysozyme
MTVSAALLADLRRDEGLRLTAYPDPLSALAAACHAAHLKPEQYEQLPGWRKLSGGPWTIGYGHAGADVLPTMRWTRDEADRTLRHDADAACTDLDDRLPWWRDLDPVRQDALANACFNLGITKLLGFKNTLRLLQDGQYEAAAGGMLQSLWARQVGDRAKRLAHMIETGARAA